MESINQQDIEVIGINNHMPSRSIAKKGSFSKLQALFRRDGSTSQPTSPLSTEYVGRRAVPRNGSAEEEEEDIDMENVWQCCDGKHDVSKLERGKMPAHHHHHHQHNNNLG